jgi:transposase
VLAAVRAVGRLECVGSTLRHALNSLALVVPDWLLAQSHSDWLERYGSRFEDSRLPEAAAERSALATLVGRDGAGLLAAIFTADAPTWLRSVPAVETLRRVWIQNYTWPDDTTLRWRTNEEAPPAGQYISSPYDHDARYSQKRGLIWIGYKIHLTESCDADLPHLITNVETTATTSDDAVTARIHEVLKQRELLPSVHLADTGYIDAELLIESERRYQINLLGPVRGDYHRQAREGKDFAAADFTIDWETQQVRCPAGRTNISWTPAIDKQTNPVIKIKFSMRECQACRVREQCTDGKRRSITVRPQEQHQALQQRRARQSSAEFKQAYAKQAGIEGTISQGVRSCDVRRTRYVGLPKTRLQHLATASAINLLRIADWLDDTPRAQTLRSAFERLYRQAS